jgi:hypothetical protein
MQIYRYFFYSFFTAIFEFRKNFVVKSSPFQFYVGISLPYVHVFCLISAEITLIYRVILSPFSRGFSVCFANGLLLTKISIPMYDSRHSKTVLVSYYYGLDGTICAVAVAYLAPTPTHVPRRLFNLVKSFCFGARGVSPKKTTAKKQGRLTVHTIYSPTWHNCNTVQYR